MSGAPSSKARRQVTPEQFVEMRDSTEFHELKTKFRGFSFPVITIALIWFLGYLIVATFMPNLMAAEVGGGFNVGLILGLLQFVTTFAITWFYVKFANKNLEPKQAAIREEMEG